MAAQIKQDPDVPMIKPDPDSKDASLTGIYDDDIYEDAGDLDFSNAAQNVWLSRIPRSLWENWSHIDEEEEIELGTIRIEGDPKDIKRVGCHTPSLLFLVSLICFYLLPTASDDFPAFVD